MSGHKPEMNRRGMTHVLRRLGLYLGLLCVLPNGLANPLAELTRSMGPGSWAPLETENIRNALASGGKSILAFSDGGAYDPVSRQFFVLGEQHRRQWKFVSYSVEKNRWQILPEPPWKAEVNRVHAVIHGYDHMALNSRARTLYHRPFSWDTVYAYDLDRQEWSALPANPFLDRWRSCCSGLEYFPPMDGLVLAGGGKVFIQSMKSGEWQLLAEELPMGPFHNFAEYNPVHNAMIFGGGNRGWSGIDDSGKAFYRLDANGKVKPLRPAPTPLGILSSVQVVDPNTGNMLVLAENSKLFSYDVVTDQWTLLDANPPIDTMHTVAAVLQEYSAIMFVSWNADNPIVYLYKLPVGSLE